MKVVQNLPLPLHHPLGMDFVLVVVYVLPTTMKAITCTRNWNILSYYM
jgi:hypothetical protein